MNMKRRMTAAVSLAAVLTFATVLPAFADYDYILSGNGRMKYTSSSNLLEIWDYKNGDYIAVHYAYTNTVCGSSGSACSPSSENGVIRLSSPNAGTYEPHTLSPGTKTYVLLKICNEDTGPDTCSNWKRSAA